MESSKTVLTFENSDQAISRNKTIGKAVIRAVEAVAITGSVSFGILSMSKTGNKIISMQSTVINNRDSGSDNAYYEEYGAINMSSGKTAAEQKTDDLEKNVDYLISHINELHRETTQSINNLETNLEKDFKDKTESLPTKDWVENTFTTKIIKILCWVMVTGLTIASTIVSIVLHFWK